MTDLCVYIDEYFLGVVGDQLWYIVDAYARCLEVDLANLCQWNGSPSVGYKELRKRGRDVCRIFGCRRGYGPLNAVICDKYMCTFLNWQHNYFSLPAVF